MEMPHNLEAEAGLLACCIIDGAEVLTRCEDHRITPEAFYSHAHRVVYEALLSLYQRKAAVDTILLCEELKGRGQLETVGGPAFISELTNRIATTAHAGHFIELIREKSRLRRLARTALSIVERCTGDGVTDASDLIAEISREVASLEDGRGSRVRTIADIAAAVRAKAEARIANPEAADGVCGTGFAHFDRQAGLWRAGESVLVSARPAQGKTSLLAQAALNAAAQGLRVALFSLEMGVEAIVSRMAQITARVCSQTLPTAPRDVQRRYLEAVDFVRSLGSLHLFDDCMTVDAIEGRIRALASGGPLALVCIDYVQLIRPRDTRANREQQVAFVSRSLKQVAMETGAVVVSGCQLSRAAEDDDAPPSLRHLRESGALEQDADVVLALHRPSKDRSGQSQIVAPGETMSAADVLLLTLKSRDRASPAAWLRFHGPQTRFAE